MKIFYLVLISGLVLSCQSNRKIDRGYSSEKEVKALGGAADDIAPVIDEKGKAITEGNLYEATPSAPKTVSESVPSTPSCDLKVNRKVVNFGSPKVTSRAFRRLRLRSKSGFRVLSVSQFDKPFDFYNNAEFPGEATYHDYELCKLSEPSNDCSVNLEFRPRAVASFNSAIKVKYLDGAGNNCNLEVGLRGNSTESYLGKDSSKRGR